MSAITEKNRLLSLVYEWQEERNEEDWNEDNIKDQIGVVASEGDTLTAGAGSILENQTDDIDDVVVKFKEGKSGSYHMNLDKETGRYSLSKTSKKSSKEPESEEKVSEEE